MPDSLDVPGGVWFRYERYEARNGYIWPSHEAKLVTYDPWEAYRVARTERGETASPYQSLFALLQSVSHVVTQEDTQRIAEWCGEHGPLGVLIHRAQVVALHPRYQPPPTGIAISVDDRSDAKVLWAAIRRYYRSSLRWEPLEQSGSMTRFVVDQPELEGALAPDDTIPPGGLPPGVLLTDLRSPEWTVEPLAGTWGRYFPIVPEAERETFFYPAPTSQGFWRLYAEPVEEFLDGALALYEAAAGLERIKPESEASEEDLVVAGRGLAILHTLTSQVKAALIPQKDGTFRQRWLAPSLLGSFAMMLLQDLAEQRRVRTCAMCGSLFTSAAYQARYCSERCRWRAQQRAHRARTRNP